MTDLDAAIDRLLAVRSQVELQRLLAEEPVLLTAEADAALAADEDEASRAGDTEGAHYVAAVRQLLAQLRNSPRITLPNLPGNREAAETVMRLLESDPGEELDVTDLTPTFFAVLESFRSQAEEQGAASLANNLADLQRRAQVAVGESSSEAPGHVAPAEAALVAVQDWINTPSREASRDFLRARPEMLSDEVATALDWLIQDYQRRGNEQAVRGLLEHRAILEQARREGIDAAYAGKAAQDDEEPDPLLQALLEWIDTPTPQAAQEYLQAHPELLTEDVAESLQAVIERFSEWGDEQAVRRLSERLRLLEQASREGVEAAYAEQAAVTTTRADLIIRLLQQWVNTPTWEASRDFLQANPDMLSDEVADTLDQVIEEFRRQGNEQAVHDLTEHQGILEQARREGIEAAYAKALASGGTRADQLLRTLQQWVNVQSWEASRQFLEAHPDLLTEEAVAALDEAIEDFRSRGDREAVRVLADHRAVLERARHKGIAAAYASRLDASPDAGTPPQGL